MKGITDGVPNSFQTFKSFKPFNRYAPVKPFPSSSCFSQWVVCLLEIAFLEAREVDLLDGPLEPAELGRIGRHFRLTENGTRDAMQNKEVPIVVEEANEIVVVTLETQSSVLKIQS